MEEDMRKKFTVWFIIFVLMVTIMPAWTITAEAKTTVKKLTLNMKSVTLQVGDSMNLKVTEVTPSSASYEVVWKSTNKKVVTVSDSGVIKAKKNGTAIVTARAKNGTAKVKCKVTVVEKKKTKSNVLVVYFSATNTTKGVAKKIAKATGADLYRITPAKKYTEDDLDYNNDSSRANTEQANKNARPSMKGKSAGIDNYDTIFIGFPIWWGDAPRIISTFMESYDFDGKTVIPFCTSGSSGISKAVKTLKSVTEGNVNWCSGKRFEGDATMKKIEKWIKSLEFLKN